MSPNGDIVFMSLIYEFFCCKIQGLVIKRIDYMKKVVITGMGIVSPVGGGGEYAWKK